MSDSGHPHYLAGLTTREQIADVLIRACLSIDLNDAAMWQSVWAASDPNVTLDLNGKLFTGMDSINGELEVVGPLDTQHITSGIRIDVHDGASTARLTATGLNQHFRPGQGMVPGAPHLLAGLRYDVELIKDGDGQWRMKTWTIKSVWSQGSWDVLQPETSK